MRIHNKIYKILKNQKKEDFLPPGVTLGACDTQEHSGSISEEPPSGSETDMESEACSSDSQIYEDGTESLDGDPHRFDSDSEGETPPEPQPQEPVAKQPAAETYRTDYERYEYNRMRKVPLVPLGPKELKTIRVLKRFYKPQKIPVDEEGFTLVANRDSIRLHYERIKFRSYAIEILNRNFNQPHRGSLEQLLYLRKLNFQYLSTKDSPKLFRFIESSIYACIRLCKRLLVYDCSEDQRTF
jgi:hypothetical protein